MLDAYPLNLPTTVALALALSLLFFKFRQSARPPGPRPLPFVGNVFQLPQVNPWIIYREWAKTYGDLIYVEVFGQPIILINTTVIVKDILDKRSLTSSNRPHLVMASELIGFNEGFVLKQYGDVEWRQQRRLMAQEFSPTAVPKYSVVQEKQACLLVQNLAKDPSSLGHQVRLHLSTLLFRVTYGYHVQSTEDHMLRLTQATMEDFTYSSTPGNFLVDIFPSLKHVPSWFPGAGFKKYAAECRKTRQSAVWEPYSWSRKSLESGGASLPNLCSTILSETHGQLSDDQHSRLALTAGSAQGGGEDTSAATAHAFFLTMIQYPEVQRKARAEIDAVVGFDRLPKASDKASLPYIRSLCTEVLRWHPAAPLGIPHVLSEDIVCEGFHLVKGSLLIPNIWSMLRHHEDFENPMEFNPERYNNSDAEMKKVTDLVFGFGRRSCPGSSFAESTLFAIITTVLATCEILPPLDKSGKPFIPRVGVTSGTISFPEDFEIRMKYRSQNAMDLLAETSAVAE